MCKIIFIFTIFIPTVVFNSHQSYAANTLNYEFGQEEQREAASGLEGAKPKIKKRINTINLSLDSIHPMISLNGTLRQERPDYSTYILRGYDDQNGIIIPNPDKDRKLDQTSYNTKEEVWMNLSTTLAKGPWSITLGGEKNITYSPFGSYTLNNSLSYGFYGQSTLVTLSSSYSEKQKPLSAYSTPTSKAGLRPTHIQEKSITLSVDQIISEVDKIKIHLAMKDQTKERPSNYSTGIKYAHAFSDTLFGKLSYSFAREDHGQALKNERGHFTQHIAGGEMTIEPIFDFLLSLSYDFIVEDEKDQRIGTVKRLGADQFGLALRYTWNNYLATNLKSSYIVTNQNQSALNAFGGIECTF